MDTEERREQRQDDRIQALEEGQKEILALLRPISETYRTATMLGKWVTAMLVFISVCVGIVLSAKQSLK
jgi:hypothetical protein